MESCRCSDIGRSPRPSVIRVTPIKRGSRQPLSQNGRTQVEQTLDEQICPNQSAEFGKTDKNRRKIKVNKWRVALPRGLEPLFSP